MALDKAFNQPRGEAHTAMMLWQSPGYPKEPHLNFFNFEIYSNPENIRVVYKIENKSDKVTQIQNSIDIALVAGDANTIGDPGTIIWHWSEDRQNPKVNIISMAPGQIYKEEIYIDRKKVNVDFQYYINAYYKGELVSQYKIIEGLYEK